MSVAKSVIRARRAAAALNTLRVGDIVEVEAPRASTTFRLVDEVRETEIVCTPVALKGLTPVVLGDETTMKIGYVKGVLNYHMELIPF